MDKSQVAVDVFDKHAHEYQRKFMDVGLYHASFDLFCDHVIRKNADILEIACGPGNITRYLLEKRPDFKILGIDLSVNMLHLAKINNPAAEFQLMDARDIGRLDKKYAAIMCGFCLPYLSKEEAIRFITDASGLLTASGVLYISTMEDDYSKSGYRASSSGDEMYMYYHQADYLTQALQENGFTIIDLRRQDYPTQDGTKTIDLLIIAGKKAESR